MRTMLLLLLAALPAAHAGDIVVRQVDGFGNVLYHKGGLRIAVPEAGFQAEGGGSETGDALLDSIKAQARYERWCLLRTDCYANMERTAPELGDLFPSFAEAARRALMASKKVDNRKR